MYTYIGGMLNFMGGYNIQLNNPLIVLKPSVFLLTDTKNYHLDVTARMEYNKMFNGGRSVSCWEQTSENSTSDILSVIRQRPYGMYHGETMKWWFSSG